MEDARFIELLDGPLRHELPFFTIMRLSTALRVVVEATGKDGEAALEDYCAAREKLDEEGYERHG